MTDSVSYRSTSSRPSELAAAQVMYPQLLVALVLCSVCLTDAYECEPFQYDLDDDCHYDHVTYYNIHHQFQEATESHQNPKPVIYLLIQLYRFTHRCASRGEAAFNIFHPLDIHIEFDVAYDNIEFEPTWINRTDELFQNDPNYPDHSDILHDDMLTMMRNHGGPGCLTALLNEFGGSARAAFFHYYPEVHQTTTTSTHSPAVTTPTHVALDCDPFGNSLDDHCDSHHLSYYHIHNMMEASRYGHHTPKHVIYHLIQLYRFAHPCASRGEAAFNIFQTHNNDIDTEYEPTWIRLTDELFDNDQYYPDDNDLSSREEFFHHYPHFYPTSPRPTTTSTHTIAATTTPTTTPTPTTTTAAATISPATTATTTTTTTSTTPTTTPTPTTTAPATTTTGSATSASTAMGYACTVCDELECLLHVHRQQCAHNEPYCLTTVKDTEHGRTITRSCADSQRCPGGLIMPDARCAKVEESSQEPGTTCHYCCSGHDCNAPPNLFPPTGFVGFGN